MGRQPKSIHDILPGVLKQLKTSREETDFLDAIREKWGVIARAPLAQHTWPRRTAGGNVLIVDAENPAWLYRACVEQNSILCSLHKEVPESSAITKISFKQKS
jgi:hypothetical protein